ncbi:MAG: Galactose/methyl galactoside import ATP-binding protein MglA [Firmicutes bacterium ADurb.Bin182]|nr:MAG: Galactose/methyl galactoside import ATP-binding protein MglA [Firmicutes bacterium ADurb.Bin182]
MHLPCFIQKIRAGGVNVNQAVEALRMENITKVYPNGVIANKSVTFVVNQGEIHALSGENGAGKSTLMKILFGEEQPTSGTIFANGQKVNISSPTEAIRLGIGMVHQHFMLVPSLTVAENMMLGIEPRKGLKIDRKRAEKEVREISHKYNLPIEPNERVEDLTVGQKQKVEILKALLRGAKILILDEPTAVLTPQETRELFAELKTLRSNGYTIIFISHKLNEVKEFCDRITIIRRGQTMGVYPLSDISEQEISKLMVGRDVILKISKNKILPGAPAIKVRNLKILEESGRVRINNISFTVREGEILGVAGVEGNGQAQLVKALTGLGPYHSGSIELCGTDIRKKSVSDIRKLSVAHIPEDRMTIGIAPRLSVTENTVIDKTDNIRFFTRLGLSKSSEIREYGKKMVRDYHILCKTPDVSVESLSGGNIQKTVLARELSGGPKVIIADQPTRGVDVGATEFIRRQLIAMRDAGNSIFLITSDLNEVLGLSDGIIVLFEGEITAYLPDASNVTEEELGQYMLGIKRQSPEQISEVLHEQKD